MLVHVLTLGIVSTVRKGHTIEAFARLDSPPPSCLGSGMVVSECLVSGNECGILQSALATLTNGEESTEAQAHLLFDTGFSRSFITQKMCEKLGLIPLGCEESAMSGFGDKKRKAEKYPSVSLQVKLPNATLKEMVASVVDVITCSIQRVPLDSEKYPILTQVKLADPTGPTKESMPVDVLVGIDYYYQLVRPGWINVSESLLLLNSEFGCIPTGEVCADNTKAENVMLASAVNTQTNELDLRAFWELKDLGISDPSHVNDDEIAMDHFNTHVQFDGERYIVQWPCTNTFKHQPNFPS